MVINGRRLTYLKREQRMCTALIRPLRRLFFSRLQAIIVEPAENVDIWCITDIFEAHHPHIFFTEILEREYIYKASKYHPQNQTQKIDVRIQVLGKNRPAELYKTYKYRNE
jgi:hypothetical protein